MRIGIFGGSFDPVHIGHLWIGEAAKECLALDALHWIPVAESPLKGRGPLAGDAERVQMLRLALDVDDGHVVDDREIKRGEVSYTVDTARQFASEFPDAELFLVIGSDSLATMGQWHRPKELLSQVVLAVVQRGGEDDLNFDVLAGLTSSDRIDLFRHHVIKMPVIELSSSELRNRIANGRSIRYRTPRAVESLIVAEKLYVERD